MGKYYEKCPDDVAALSRQAMHDYHPDLEKHGVTVTHLFARVGIDDDADPVTVNGYPAIAAVKIIGLKERVDGRADAEIVIDGDKWDRANESQRLAILDHELTHLELKRDNNGNIIFDDLHRPKLEIRKHDHQFGWFDEVARRHAGNSIEVMQAKRLMESDGQLYFEWVDESDKSGFPARQAAA